MLLIHCTPSELSLLSKSNTSKHPRLCRNASKSGKTFAVIKTISKYDSLSSNKPIFNRISKTTTKHCTFMNVIFFFILKKKKKNHSKFSSLITTTTTSSKSPKYLKASETSTPKSKFTTKHSLTISNASKLKRNFIPLMTANQ